MLRKSNDRARQRFGIWNRCKTLRSLKQIHALMIINGFLSDPSSLRELIFSSSISIPCANAIHYAYKLFDQIPKPDIFMWNSIIRAASHSSNPYKAIQLYTKMVQTGTKPNSFTFPFILRACTSLYAPLTGTQIHAKITKLGFESDGFVRNALINMHANIGDIKIANDLFNTHSKRDIIAWSCMIAGFARRGELKTARKLFDECPERDLISYNVMISSYAKHGEMEASIELFNQIPRPDIVSWNAIISGYVKCGSHKKAIKLFKKMCQAGVRPDDVTILSLLSTCADSASLEIGQRLHNHLLEDSSLNGLSVKIQNALMDMYAKCGCTEKASKVFRSMRELEISSWNSIICGLAFNGHVNETLNLFVEMLERKYNPDEITFVGVLIACNHAGLVQKGYNYFHLMQNIYKIKPNIKHYGCMVDLLGRAGLVKEAFDFVNKMKIEGNSVIWRSLLGACRKFGERELGEIANRELLRGESVKSGDFVLLSNIYASMGSGAFHKM
ncbi:hypothetical protein LUZ60_005800 [Juncus effusus]|nr:hypothetical protein LUZ60_005800 [Juncus effusus]